MNIVRARLKPYGGATEFISVKGRIKSLIERNVGDTFHFVVDDSGVKSVKEFGPDNINPELVGQSVSILDGPYHAMFNEDGTITVVVPENEGALPRQQTVDQLKKLRKMTRGVDIGDRISDMNKQGANIQYIQNPVDTGIESYEDYQKKNKSWISSWNAKGLLGPYPEDNTGKAKRTRIKKFTESWESGYKNKADQKLCDEIVEDLFPQFKARQDKGEKISYREFEETMKKGGATYDMFEKVMMDLVEMGINFYSEDEGEEGSDKMFSFFY
jgi:hypothetical protein